MKLEKDILEHQLEEYGEIEQFEDEISFCPYCGYGNGWNFEYYDDVDFMRKTCYECDKDYLEKTDIYIRHYTITKPIGENLK